MRDGIVCQVWDDPRSPSPWYRAFVPSHLRRRVLQISHGNAHLRPEKMLAVLRRYFVWPGFSRQTKEWCRACLICQERESSRNPAGDLGFAPIPTSFGEVFSVDLMALRPTVKGNKYLMLIIDLHSRFVIARALHNKDPQQLHMNSRQFFEISSSGRLVSCSQTTEVSFEARFLVCAKCGE